MAEAPASARAEPRDGLEPSGVATGRVWLAVAAVFLLPLLALAGMLVFLTRSVHGSTLARARPFAAPALETSVSPRMLPDRGPGPRPYRELPAVDRPARLGAPDPRLADAERAIAARGAQAYDPLPGEDAR